MTNNWPNSFIVTLEEHMAHMHHLMRDGVDFERESALYHALNWALTFTAMRTGVEGKCISIHPQPELRMLGKPRPQPSRSAYQLRSRGPVPDIPALNIAYELSLLNLGAVGLERGIDDDAAVAGEDQGDEEVFLSAQYSSLSQATTGPSALSSVPEIPQDSFRRPDFASIITFPDGHERVLFLHEAKAIPAFLETSTKERRAEAAEALRKAFSSTIEQATEQAQFYFSQYPAGSGFDQVHVMVTVNFHCTVYKFTRKRTPKYERGQKLKWQELPQARYGPFYLLREDGQDYHEDFKRCWTRLKNLAK